MARRRLQHLSVLSPVLFLVLIICGTTAADEVPRILRHHNSKKNKSLGDNVVCAPQPQFTMNVAAEKIVSFDQLFLPSSPTKFYQYLGWTETDFSIFFDDAERHYRDQFGVDFTSIEEVIHSTKQALWQVRRPDILFAWFRQMQIEGLPRSYAKISADGVFMLGIFEVNWGFSIISTNIHGDFAAKCPPPFSGNPMYYFLKHACCAVDSADNPLPPHPSFFFSQLNGSHQGWYLPWCVWWCTGKAGT